MSTEETKYLKIHQKIAYGFGDFGAKVIEENEKLRLTKKEA